MHLHHVHAVDEHAARLEEHANHFPFFTFVFATHHPHGVSLGDAHLGALGVLSVTGGQSIARRLPVFQNSHFISPQERARRSSCTSCRGAHAPRVRRCASRSAHPVR